ncbi:MAG TPA: hypothetical protein VK843_16835 [Planctomycetota bacterium]|nr:hypothetical protein [Planctomycetota bacterium]
MQTPQRTRRSWLLALIVGAMLVALACALWIGLHGRTPNSGVEVARDPSTSESVPSREDVSPSPIPAPKDPPTQPGLAEPVRVGRQEIERDHGEQVAVEILVLRKTEQSPITGCEVLYFEGADFETSLVQRMFGRGFNLAEMRLVGRRAITDDSGRVRILVEAGRLVTMAITPQESGGEDFDVVPGQNESRTIHCEPAVFVRAQVIDSSGKPRSGVDLSINRKVQRVLDFGFSATTSGREGIAELGPLKANDGEYVVSLTGAFPESLRVVVDLSSLPKEPIQLVLPAQGSIEVRVLNPDGSRFEGEAEVSLESAQDRVALENNPSESISIGSGVAVFKCVGLGLSLNARVTIPWLEPDLEVRGQGPQVGGTRVVLEARLAVTHATLTGRAESEQGPLKFHELECVGAVQGTWGSRQFQLNVITDESGKFALTLKDELPGDGEGTLLVRDIDEKRPLGAVRSIEVKRAGNPLGLWLLQEPRLLASGRVVDENGQPVPRAVELVDPARALGIGRALLCDSDDLGAFELRGWSNELTINILAGSRGAAVRQPITVAQGATDVVLPIGQRKRAKAP